MLKIFVNGRAYGAGVLLTVFLPLLFGPPPAVMPLLLRGPYIQDVAGNRATLVWVTAAPGASEVQYGPGVARSLRSEALTEIVDGRFVHVARLTGLIPGQRYTYRILTAGADLTPWSDAAFETATGGTRFSFSVFGNSRSASPEAQALAAQVAAIPFAFVLNTGDLANQGSTVGYDAEFFSVFGEALAGSPFYPVPGSHDYAGGSLQPYLDAFFLPAISPQGLAEHAYSFDWGNAHVVALDTFQPFGPDAPQYRWLVADLGATRKLWKFVLLPHPPYSSGYHGSIWKVREVLGPLFEQYGVDLVFAGHDSDYERTQPMIAGRPAAAGAHGVTYVVTGGGGAELTPVGQSAFTASAASRHHFVRVDINGCTLALAATAPGGEVFDTYTLTKCPLAWTQVNDDGFDEHPGESYNGQEGFELTTFDEQFYLGMEGRTCARIWRSRAGVTLPVSQADWEQVVANGFDGNGDCADPAGTDNDHIDSLEPFGGYLYASTAMQTGACRGTQVWRSASGDAGSWQRVNEPGFGLHTNENFKDMVVFAGRLCGGTMNAGELVDLAEPEAGYAIAPGAQVWCTDGSTRTGDGGLRWTQQNRDGFGEPENVTIWSTAVFGGALYAGVAAQSSMSETDGAGRPGSIWRTQDITDPDAWQRVFFPPDYDLGGAASRVDVLAALNGYLYIGFEQPGRGTQIWRSTSGDRGTWEPVVTDGFGTVSSGRIISDGATAWAGALYVAALNEQEGITIWRTPDGLAWEPVSVPGFGDRATFAAQLAPFGNYLYAWASNYARGQQIWRGSAAR